jgi:hypothetical protein
VEGFAEEGTGKRRIRRRKTGRRRSEKQGNASEGLISLLLATLAMISQYNRTVIKQARMSGIVMTFYQGLMR